MSGGARVVVVTGGGGGIGAAIAEELGRRGDHVVTMDPLVSLDGSEQLPAPEETTAGRIVAAGGSARASSVSVADADGVRALFDDLVEQHGRLDGVVNVAGITRQTSFATGGETDWHEVLTVHLDGYRNILEAALPIMAGAGHGRILGVTSGSGWRAADAGAYSCAKRAVASLTWQLGRVMPDGVVVNAISPIAVTRMVTAALERARAASAGSNRGGASSTGGLSLGSMPEPADLGPLGAHLVGEGLSWCSGQAIFAGGSEVAVINPPRLLEVVRTTDAASLPHLLESVAPAWVQAEGDQASGGGSNPRFGDIYADATGELPPPVTGTCAIVTDRSELGAGITTALEARGVRTCVIDATGADTGFDGAVRTLASAAEQLDGLDAAVVALAGRPGSTDAMTGWERVLAEHRGIVDDVHADARWARAASDVATDRDHPLRLVTLTDATTSGGRSRAQAAAQLARASRKTTREQVAAFAVSIEADGQPVAEIAAYLVCSPTVLDLSGAELVAGAGWCGLRAHPRPSGSIAFGGPGLPEWFDDALRAVVEAR
ncbi:MAG: SDR family NAD(P)-dependent oxidoreductase [Acidimicrobiia bacterium]|nr:SDR family NAD(P)-dependent oxidoreductase [Acidimicrobiia bacterium]